MGRHAISRSLVQNIFEAGTLQLSAGEPVTEDTFKGKKAGGSKPKWDREAIKAEVKTIPLKKRKTDKALAGALGIPYSTVYKMRKHEKIFKKHKSFLKPKLTEEHKIARIQYALSMRDPNDSTKYRDMYDTIHVDKKWFYLCRDGEAYLLVDNEEPPDRSVLHKKHITKVQFLAATARPRKINGEWWDGKVGLWLVGSIQPAQRSSKN